MSAKPPRLIHAPVLDGEVRHGEHLARLLLDLPRQPVRRDRHRHPRLVAGDPAPPQPLRHRRRRPAAAEKVGNNIAFIGRGFDDALKECFWLLSWITDTFLS